MFELLFWPFLAGLVLTGIHAYFGMHVLARGIVFVDLSLAQVAALGITVSILAGHTVQSDASYWYALSFAIGGAILFALARRYEHAVQQEAVIGVVYAVCTALGVLALDRAPQGAEHIKQILIGSILTVESKDVFKLAAIYSSIGAVHWFFRKPLMNASFQPATGNSSRHVFFWDAVFYGSFALVVTSSVRMAGVLLVFSYLIVPAAISGLFVKSPLVRLSIAWAIGIAITAAGLGLSWSWELPTGPAIVATFGAVAAIIALGFAVRYMSTALVVKLFSGVIAVAGLLMFAFPQMDQPWIDLIERKMPFVHEVFLTPEEMDVRQDTIETIDRATAELTRLRALEQDVQWGAQKMDQEKQERLRQYLASRSEILAGDQLVLQDLRKEARSRQRYGLGIPLILIGVAGFLFSVFRKNNK